MTTGQGMALVVDCVQGVVSISSWRGAPGCQGLSPLPPSSQWTASHQAEHISKVWQGCYGYGCWICRLKQMVKRWVCLYIKLLLPNCSPDTITVNERFLIWQNVSNLQVATRFLWQQVKIVWVLFNGHGDDGRCASNCNNLIALWSWVTHVIQMALRGFPVWYQALERSSRRGNLYRALRCGTEGILAGSDLVICVTLSWATPVLCNCWPSLLQGGMMSIICWVGGISILMHGLCFLSCQWLFLHRWWQEARF